ncbi:uncharacterized protein LOC111801019 [Cucurbita pepo subsp. pepo]|uniref:uncharacterized protein LOC111801019 n=1 Tax=Cucurbita pepo subsp. pepo TaxID=3664 RepID=UPI000C9D7733|nr:uncharacterized protein LOC111801019 [Cucurbita pepo subsp. pepo]
MALGHRRSWKITVHAKVNDLYIKFKATVKRPSGKFRSLLNLDKLLVGLDSKSESRILVQQHRTLKSRIISFVKKHFRRRRSKTGVGFKMPDPYLVDETEYQSWRLGRAESSCAAVFGVGLGYLLAEFGASAAVKRVGIIPSLSSFLLVCVVLFVLLFHKSKFLWAMLMAVLSLLLLEIDRFLELIDLEQFW